MQADSSARGGGGAEDAAGVASLLERVAGLLDGVQATQRRMDERQLELESAVGDIRAGVLKLAAERAGDADVLEKLLEKTRKVSRHVKDVRVRLENQNLRVKKVEATQGDLLAKNKFRVVIYQGEQEVRSAAPAAADDDEGESLKAALPPDSDDDEYMVVEEADPAAAAAGRHKKKAGLTRMESLKAAFSRENMSRTRDSLGTKVNKLGERIVTAERRQKIRQSGERLKETLAKNVLKKERTVAEGQEGADPAAAAAEGGAAPVPPPKGRRAGAAPPAEEEVPVYDMKRLS